MRGGTTPPYEPQGMVLPRRGVIQDGGRKRRSMRGGWQYLQDGGRKRRTMRGGWRWTFQDGGRKRRSMRGGGRSMPGMRGLTPQEGGRKRRTMRGGASGWAWL